MERYKKLEEYFLSNYSEEQYPTLKLQREEWSKTKPLNGLKVLDVTPLCRNSIYKYMNLIYGGAELFIGISLSDDDPILLSLLNEAGIEVVSPDDFSRSYDIIMDCSAEFIEHTPAIGCVELTRARSELYANKPLPVFMADGGDVKRIETCLGTGESYFRAMKQLGYGDMRDKKVVLFGSGKVGQGIIRGGAHNGAIMTVITDKDSFPSNLSNLVSEVVDYRSKDDVERVIKDAYAVVTATGVEGAVEASISADKLLASGAILANMGATDEYGETIAESAVLANKDTINFILDDPTLLQYIDATMTLHNYGATYILNNREIRGVIMPPKDIEAELLRQTAECGVIASELNEIYK